METEQIKSKQRVRELGEVFTGEREVKAMCDLVGGDIADISKRVLEPAAGNGNFLVEILQRRIASVQRKNLTENSSIEFALLVALSNIYAVDIMLDNVKEARQRLKKIMLNAVTDLSDTFESAVDTLLKTNIICGNFLTRDTKKILIYEWLPNYEKQTFDITEHTLNEIKRTARKTKTSINAAQLAESVDELRYPKPISPKIKPKPVKTETGGLFDDIHENKIDKLRRMAEQ